MLNDTEFLKTPLIKLTATGNDFILVDLLDKASVETWKAESQNQTRAQWAKRWCDRHNGLGADGVAFIESSPQSNSQSNSQSPLQSDFTWDFYNSDGSLAEMCGNAARAVSLYVAQKLKRANLEFITQSGNVSAHVHSKDDIDVTMAPIAEEAWNQWSDNPNDQLNFDFVRSGVPHAVLRVPDIQDRERLKALALEIKREPRFQAHGTNVTFVRPVSDHKIESVTFERGVEDFTLACGTGAVAAAHALLRGEENRTLEVQVPGGQLFVVWKKGRPHLRGPARIVAQIRWIKGD